MESISYDTIDPLNEDGYSAVVVSNKLSTAPSIFTGYNNSDPINEDGILGMIAAAMDGSKLQAAIKSLLSIIQNQRMIITGLEGRVEEFDSKFEAMELYMLKLTDKTVGEHIGIQPLGRWSNNNSKSSMMNGSSKMPKSIAKSTRYFKNQPVPIVIDEEAFSKAVKAAAVETPTSSDSANAKQLFDRSTVALTVTIANAPSKQSPKYPLLEPRFLQSESVSLSVSSNNSSFSKVLHPTGSFIDSTTSSATKKSNNSTIHGDTEKSPNPVDIIDKNLTKRASSMVNEQISMYTEAILSSVNEALDVDDDDDKAPKFALIRDIHSSQVQRNLKRPLAVKSTIHSSRVPGQSKRRMNVAHLSFLTRDRRLEMMKELRVRGHFLKAVRNMVVNRTKKQRDGNLALRKRISDMETVLEAIVESIETQKRTMRTLAQSAEKNRTQIEDYSNILSSAGLVASDAGSSAAPRERPTHVVNLNYQLDGDGNVKPRENNFRPSGALMLPEKATSEDGEKSQTNFPISTDENGQINISKQLIEEIRKQLNASEGSDCAPDNKEVFTKRQLDLLSNYMTAETIQTTIDRRLREYLRLEDMDTDYVAGDSSQVNRNDRASLIRNLTNKVREELMPTLDSRLDSRFEAIQALQSQQTAAREDEEGYRKTVASQIVDINKDIQRFHSQLQELSKGFLSLREKVEDDEEENEGMSIRTQLKKVSGGLFVQSEKHIRDVKELSNALQKLGQTVEGKPTVQTVEKMMELTDTTFRRVLGQNITGVNQAVLQVVKAVQRKADKDEITRMIAKRIYDLEHRVQVTLESGTDEAAGSTRCLSCGNFSKPKILPVFDTLDFDPDGPFKALRVQPAANQQQDDADHGHGLGLSEFSNSLTSSTSSLPQSLGPISQRSLKSSRSTEPLYRRARAAAANKEAVKAPLRLSTPSLPLMVPISANQGNMYILDPTQDNSSHFPTSVPPFPEVSTHSRHSANGSVNSLRSSRQ